MSEQHAADPVSAAFVTTDRPQRYGKQLTQHLGHKRPAVWMDSDGRGTVTFDHAAVELAATPTGLRLAVHLSAPTPTDGTPELEHIEDVVGRHLVRFGARDELVVRWQRSDGSPGTEQA